MVSLSHTGLALCDRARTHNGPLFVVVPDVAHIRPLSRAIRFFGHDTVSVHGFPDWETLPYDHFSPHQDITSQRLRTLYRMPSLSRGNIIIVSVSTLMQRVAPRGFIDGQTFMLRVGEQLDFQQLRERLTASGYRSVSQVMAPGEFCVRGSLMDVFVMGSEFPLRIDLFDDEIETLRSFDPDTQRTLEKIDSVDCLPAHEFPLTEDAISQFRQQWRTRFEGDPRESVMYQSVSDGIAAAGIEYYSPLFFEKMGTLFDYLPKDVQFVPAAHLVDAAETFWREIGERYEQLRYDVSRPLLAPSDLFLPVDQLFSCVKPLQQINLDVADVSSTELSLDTLKAFLDTPSQRTLICAESPGRREVLLELLQARDIKPALFDSWSSFVNSNEPVGLTVAALDDGMVLPSSNLAVVAEAQLFAEHVAQHRRRKTQVQDPDAVIRDLSELAIGAPVVHLDHGVGFYRGLQHDADSEFLMIEYAREAMLYVPITSLHLMSRYTGVDSDHVTLHELGSKKWQQAKRKAFSKIRDSAAELLQIYAKRQQQTGDAYELPVAEFTTFAENFQFETTHDQQNAIDSVVQDLTSEKLMDRLICGDVGFGKTEVAMRAAFLAIQNNQQVAVLVPTTVLAEQHYQNFSDRFADWPVKVAALSRFRTTKEADEILSHMAAGTADIVIGTHKLLQPSIKFKKLGVLVIDEEHRFGVRHKEKMKALKANVNVLTLTATPIPRTLNLAMTGVRDLSIIATPPSERLAVKTFVHKYQNSLVREAVLRESLRGGQVYFLHNEVKSIHSKAEELSRLIPEAKIRVAHGQMRERELEQIMADFYHQKFNVLLCTTIIESGIDVPSANTIIINRADKLGLAQLHQLRGRVGRSHHQAYAYLLVPEEKELSKDAEKRLDALASMETLGAGFMLATHDLEIRGAGELLGESQSGHMQTIGFSLYMDLLERAVKALQNGEEIALEDASSVEVDLKIPAFIPDVYIPDVNQRLNLYKRLASAKNEDGITDIRIEMIDRFGKLPQQVQFLFDVTRVKLLAETLGLSKITANAHGATIVFSAKPTVDAGKLIRLVQANPQQYRLHGQEKLMVKLEGVDASQRVATLMEVLSELDPGSSPG